MVALHLLKRVTVILFSNEEKKYQKKSPRTLAIVSSDSRNAFKDNYLF